MVKKILTILHTEVSGLHQAAYLLGVFAFLSQFLALIRDRLFAYVFGASHTLDLYYAAFRIPDFIFASIASVVSLSVLIPFLVEKIDADPNGARKFISDIFSIFLVFIVVVSGVLFFFAPSLVHYFFPTFYVESGTLLVSMTRILLLSPIFLGLSNFFASITQVHKRFFIYAISPLLYNIGIIFGILVLYPFFGLKGIAFGVVLGAFFHFAIQVPFVLEKGLFPKFNLSIDFASVKRVVFLSLPRTLTASSNEIAEFLLISFASLMSAGSISVFNFSFNLQSVPLSIIGVSYSLAAFPALVRYFNSGKREEFVAQMVASAKHIIFWSTPVTVLFIVLRAQVVRVILGSGHFSWSDTRLTAATLAIFAVSIVPQSLMLLFVRSYYARGNTKKPLLMNFISATFIVVFGYFFSKLFVSTPVFRTFFESLLKVENLEGSRVLALPLAFSIGVSINALIHWIDFHFDYREFSRPVFKTFFHSVGASLVMGFVSYSALGFLSSFVNQNTTIGIFLQGFIAGILGIVSFVLVLKLLKNEELSEVWNTLHRKFWKTKVIVGEEVPL